MAVHYADNPHNFDEITPYIIMEREKIVQKIINADKCYFYDACSFRRHVQMKHSRYIFEFIKKYNGVVVITRCILMELASYSGNLNSEYVEYIRKMYESEIEVLVIYEEYLFDVLSACFTTNAIVNRYLSLAVKAVKRPTSTIESTMKADKELLEDIIGDSVTECTLYDRFFKKVRNNKEAGDNLGEELIAICVHLLSNIPENHNYKYVVLTEDKAAIGLINKTFKNVLLHSGVQAFSALTTNRLAQRLYEENLISEKTQVEEVLATGNAGSSLRILASEEYDLEPKEKTMTCSELAEKIVTQNAIHINY